MKDEAQIRQVWTLTRDLLQKRLADIATAKQQLDHEAEQIGRMLGNGSVKATGTRRGRSPKAAGETTTKKTTKVKGDPAAGAKAVAHLKKHAG